LNTKISKFHLQFLQEHISRDT